MNEQELIQKLQGLFFLIFISYEYGGHFNARYDAQTFLSETEEIFSEELTQYDAKKSYAEFKNKFLEFAELQLNNMTDVTDFWFELENTTSITVTFNPKFGSRG